MRFFTPSEWDHNKENRINEREMQEPDNGLDVEESDKKQDEEENKYIKKNIGGDEEVLNIMNIYQTDKTQACTLMINKLEGLIYYIIKHRFGAYAKPDVIDDMYQQACMGIMQAMDRYDAASSAPTTFMKYYIVDAIKICVNRDVYNTSSYYSKIMKHIRQLISARATKGEDTTENDVVLILGSKYPKISTATLKDCYRQVLMNDQANYKMAETDDEEEQGVASISTYDTPEQLFLDKERKRLLYSALEKLPLLEKYVIICQHGLFQTDKDNLEEILHNYTEYSMFEKFLANGYTHAQILSMFGFSRVETLMLRGLSKKQATYAAQVMEANEGTDTEEFQKIFEYLTDAKSDLTLCNNCNDLGFTKVLRECGHTDAEIKSIISGESVAHVRLADVKDIPVKTLLIAKGFTQQDIMKVLHGEALSNNKTAILLNLKQANVKMLETKAFKKMYRSLRLNFAERTHNNSMNQMLNATDLKIQPDTMEYVATFYDELEEIEEDFVDEFENMDSPVLCY